MRANGADGGQLLLGAEPFLDLQRLGVGHVDVQRQMLEVALQHTARTLDGHDAAVHLGLDTLRDLHALVRIDGLHFVATVDAGRLEIIHCMLRGKATFNLKTTNVDRHPNATTITKQVVR